MPKTKHLESSETAQSMTSPYPERHYSGLHSTAEEGADSGRCEGLEINHFETQTFYFPVTKDYYWQFQ